MIVFVVNFIPLLMCNYLIYSVSDIDKNLKLLVGYTLLEIYILYLIIYG